MIATVLAAVVLDACAIGSLTPDDTGDAAVTVPVDVRAIDTGRAPGDARGDASGDAPRPSTDVRAVDVSRDSQGNLQGDAQRDVTVVPVSDAGADVVQSAPMDATVIAQVDVVVPPPVVCGDGVIDWSESCDDGNHDDGDGCSADCHTVECAFDHAYQDPATHHCYWRRTDVIARADAESVCESLHGYLARFATDDERRAAYPVTLGDVGGRIWVGLQFVDTAWAWDDGVRGPDPFTSAWSSGEPSGNGTCVQWVTGGDSGPYDDLGCTGNRRDYVCEREPAGRAR